MKHLPLEDSLSTASGLGIVLKPSEFDHISDCSEDAEIKQSPEKFNKALAMMLLGHMPGRSMLGPFIERRTIIVIGMPPKATEEKTKGTSSHSSPPMRKMGSAYDSYRHGVMNMVAHSQDLIGDIAGEDIHLAKLAGAPADQVFTPMSVAYIQDAFRDESGETKIAQASATVERATPSKNTLSMFNARRVQ